MFKSKTVAIIGAGASGLVCAKVLMDDGFKVTIFERQREIGGIDVHKQHMLIYIVNHPEEHLNFLIYSMVKVNKFVYNKNLSIYFSIEEYPSWQNVHDYLQKYADLFHITECIQFQTRVLSVWKEDIKNADIPWVIKTETINGQQQTNEFDYVIVATGLFSEPYIPIYRGQDKFAGSILPPSAIKSGEQLENKRVIIIGCGKCATDMAVLAARYARSCHLIFRKAHWMTPRTLMNGLLPAKFLCSRALSIPFSPVPGAPYGTLFRFLHEKFPKFFIKITDNISNDIMSIHGPDLSNDKIFIPQHSYRNLENISIIPQDFIRFKREGRFIGKLGSIDGILDETKIRLDTGEILEADLIISATGFIRRFPFFTQQHAQMMGLVTTPDQDVDLNLYQRVIPVDIPNIGFIGFTASVGYWMIAEVASHWISDYFLQRLQLPSSEEMYKEIQTTQTFLLKIFNRCKYDFRYYWTAPIEIYLNDMGLTLHRTNNWISEYFGVYRPERLKGLHYERKILANTGRRPRHFYFSLTLNLFLILLFILIYFIFLK